VENEEKQCSNCSKMQSDLPDNQIIHKFDGTGNDFCSQKCCQAFYQAKQDFPSTADQAFVRTNNKVTDELSSEEVRFENTSADKLVLDMETEEIENYINICRREIQRWKIHEQHARLGKAKLALDADGNIVREIRERKAAKKKRAEGKSPLQKAYESMAAQLGCSIDEVKLMLENQKT